MSESANKHHLKVRRYVLRLDSGLRDLDQDLQNTLTQAIECLDQLSSGVEELSRSQKLNHRTRSALTDAGGHVAHLLTLLQVGDRTYQKIEALRVVLQEFSDHLFAGDGAAPNLHVKTQVYDQNMIPKDEEIKGVCAEKPMSQDDIDTFFG